MFGTKALPASFSELFGRPTLYVAGFFTTAWIALFALGTMIILPAWNAGDAGAVFFRSMQTAIPLMVVTLFGTIATFGAYGISHRSTRSD